MSLKVKRGLGLLVVALLGYLVVSLGQSLIEDDRPTLGGGIEALGWAGVAVGLLGGLVLLAWGLLRD